MPVAKRRPQINFQVDDAMKTVYDEAKAQGHWVTRFCAAGFLLMVENPRLRLQAIQRLRDWEAEYSHAGVDQIRRFVEGAANAMQPPSPDTKPKPKAPRGGKKPRRPESD